MGWLARCHAASIIYPEHRDQNCDEKHTLEFEAINSPMKSKCVYSFAITLM